MRLTRRAIVALALAVAVHSAAVVGCRGRTGRPATPEASPATPAATTVAPGSSLSDADRAAIYAAVVRHLFTGEDSFGRRHRPAVVYLLRWTDERAGDPRRTGAERAPIPEAVQAAVTEALKDLPARVVWVESQAQVPMDSRTGAVRGPGAVVTLGAIRLQPEGAVHVGVSIWAASLAAAGQTCVVERKDGAWVVTGTTGVRWMS